MNTGSVQTLIVLREEEHAWLQDLFRSRHPMLVTLCNKPFIEYLIDFAILSGSEALRIASDSPITDLENYCGNGSRWGITIDYAHILPEDDQERLLEKNRQFCSRGKTMLIEKTLFVAYDKKNDYRLWLRACPEGVAVSGTSGSITILGNKQENAIPGPGPGPSLPMLLTIGEYYRLADDTLKNADRYILPGYSSEPDCFLGRNVVIQKGAEIRKPVMIGNNVQISAGSIIGPGAIIGSNIIIDRESVVSGSILMDNTFIGEQLEVKGRIADGSLLIDPESGATLQMEDPHLMSVIQPGASTKQIIRRLIHALAALALLIVLALPFLVLRPLLGLRRNWHTKKRLFPPGATAKKLTIEQVVIRPEGADGRLAIALSIDRYPSLFQVLGGKLRLIGHRPAVSSDTSTISSGCIAMNPAVFGYAETEEWPENERDELMVDHYHLLHSGSLKDIGLLLKALLNKKHM